MALSPAKIVCAAMRNENGLIICGPRHYHSVMYPILDILGKKFKWEQGFVDQHGVFYNRQDAWKIAVENNQIFRRVGGDEVKGGTLYSENLY